MSGCARADTTPRSRRLAAKLPARAHPFSIASELPLTIIRVARENVVRGFPLIAHIADGAAARAVGSIPNAWAVSATCFFLGSAFVGRRTQRRESVLGSCPM